MQNINNIMHDQNNNRNYSISNTNDNILPSLIDEDNDSNMLDLTSNNLQLSINNQSEKNSKSLILVDRQKNNENDNNNNSINNNNLQLALNNPLNVKYHDHCDLNMLQNQNWLNNTQGNQLIKKVSQYDLITLQNTVYKEANNDSKNYCNSIPNLKDYMKFLPEALTRQLILMICRLYIIIKNESNANNNYKKQIIVMRNKLNNIKTALNCAKQEMTSKAKDNKKLRQAIHKFNVNKSQLNNELCKYQSQLNKLNHAKNKMESSAKNYINNLNQQKNNELKSFKDHASKKINEKNDEIQNLKNQMAILKSQLSQFENKLNNHEKSNKSLEIEKNKLNTENLKLKKEQNQIVNKFNELNSLYENKKK